MSSLRTLWCFPEFRFQSNSLTRTFSLLVLYSHQFHNQHLPRSLRFRYNSHLREKPLLEIVFLQYL
ncbi:hypothetical protein LINGRAHAP2_LOCUS20399 [Linum grandiflorum]